MVRNGEKAPGTGRLLAGMRGMDRSGDGRICLGMDGRSAGEEGVGGTCGLSEQFGKRFDVHATFDGSCCKRVPKRVKAFVRNM